MPKPDYPETTEEDWLNNSTGSGMNTSEMQTSGNLPASRKALRNFGMSQSKIMGSSSGSTFSGSFRNVIRSSSRFDNSMDKNSANFKVPQLKPRGLSQARFDKQKSCDDAMETDGASSFSSSIGTNGRNKQTEFAVPARFNSSLSKRDFSSFNNSFGDATIVTNGKFASSFDKRNYGSPFSKENFGGSTDGLRFNEFCGQSTHPPAAPFSNSFGSTGSRVNANGLQFVTNLNSSKGSLNNSFRSSADGGSNKMNKSFGRVSLSSFGQMKPDFLSYESAQKKLHNSRNH